MIGSWSQIHRNTNDIIIHIKSEILTILLASFNNYIMNKKKIQENSDFNMTKIYLFQEF